MWAESIVGLEITPRARAILQRILLPNPRVRRFISPRAVTPCESPLQSPPPPVPSPNRRFHRLVSREWTTRPLATIRLPRAAPPPLPNPATPSPGQHRASTHATLPHCLPPIPFSPESSSPAN